MTNERPPQVGLTRRDTKHPHPLYPGWYVEDAEMLEIARRADTAATESGVIPAEEIRRAPMRAVSRDTVLHRKGKAS